MTNFLSKFDTEKAVLEIHPIFYACLSQMIYSRALNSDIPFWDLMICLGEDAQVLINADNIYDEKLSDVLKRFYINFAFLMKFIYPMYEQMQMVIDQNIVVSHDQKD